jgi:hypothetical protein
MWIWGLSSPAFSDTSPELKKFNPQFVFEPGCPVEVLGASTDLELDPFGAPIAARHYIDYRNVSNKPVAAVKFRIGYIGADGKISLPFVNGDDAHLLQPGEQASKKWRGDRVDPQLTAIKMRVLMVKFTDGSVWESVKLSDTNAQPQQGYAPLSTERPPVNDGSAETFSPRRSVPLRDYGQQNYQGYPGQTATGAVPLTAPSSAGGGGAMPSQQMPGAMAAPSFAPSAASAPAQNGWGAPPSAPAQNGWGAPYAGMAPANMAPTQGDSVAPAAAAPSFAPAYAPPAASAYTPAAVPNAAAAAAANMDPIATIDQFLGTGKPATPKPAAAQPAAVAPLSASPATPASSPQATPSDTDAPVLRPKLTPGQPIPDGGADVPAGDGDKSLQLR